MNTNVKFLESMSIVPVLYLHAQLIVQVFLITETQKHIETLRKSLWNSVPVCLYGSIYLILNNF